MIYSRYGDVSFIVEASLEQGLRFCFKAMEGRNEDRAYQRWIITNQCSVISFDDYMDKFKAKKILSEDELVAKKKKIDEKTKLIEEKLLKKR